MKDSTQIDDLVDETRQLCTTKGWRESLPPDPRENREPYSQYVFGAYIALVHSEASEALEAYRDKVWSETCTGHDLGGMPDHIPGCNGRPHDNPKPVGVGPELADILIRVLDMADLWGIDIQEEIGRVMEYGWTRPYQHGGRTL